MTIHRLLSCRWLWLSTAIVVLAMLYVFNPTDYVLMPKCLFKLLTGWQCPGCGFQRATHALLHGHLAQAWAYNRFLVYAIPWLFLVMLTEWGPSSKYLTRLRRIVVSRWAIGFYLIATIAWGISRNILGI